MKLGVIALIPGMLSAVKDFGVVGRAFERGLVELTEINPRDFALDRHSTVDDRPYGGGPGMVLKAEPVIAAVAHAKDLLGRDAVVVHFSPRGVPLDQARLARWVADRKPLIFIASRYEGVDQRAIDLRVDEEVCVGDFVVSGGELPVMMALDALIRLLPGVLGDESSKNDESFVDGLLEYPQYTRPETVMNLSVPEVLVSGDHRKIALWRQTQARLVTEKRRPDLLAERKKTVLETDNRLESGNDPKSRKFHE